jgi:hypothetical protein
VTLSNPDPEGGALVTLSSSSSAPRLPDTVAVPAGASSASFTITTAATDLEQTSTVSASYSGVLVSTTLVISRRPLTVSLTVSSSTRRADACALKDGGANFDCSLDASASKPSSIIHTYFWTNTISGHGQTHTQSYNSTDPISRPDTGCTFAFISGLDPQADGSGGYFVPMTITLYVESTTRERSTTLTRTVRVYPNRLCNYEF